ncbi:MAG: choice-of-anchor D domain-containing protein, partial [Planctomycetota bacterium]
LDSQSNLIVSNGSVGGTNISIPNGCGITNANNVAVLISGGGNNTVDSVNLSYTGGGNSGFGVLIQNQTGNTVVQNCISNNHTYGTFFSNLVNLSVLNNSYTSSGNNGAYAVYIDTVSGTLSATGNTFAGTFQGGISLNSLSNRIISDGSIGGTHISIPNGCGITGASNQAVLINSGGNNTVDSVNVSYTGGGNSGQGVQIQNQTGNTIVQNCTLNNRTYGTLLTNLVNLSLLNNSFTSSGNNGAYAVYIDSVSGTLSATGNTFAGTFQGGISLNSLSNRIISDGSIGGTHISIPNGCGITGASNQAVLINSGGNNTVDSVNLSYTGGGNVGTGITIQNNTGTTVFQNCTINNRTYGMIVSNLVNFSLLNNSYTSSGNNGGYVAYIDNVTGALAVTGNTFAGTFESALSLVNLSNPIISDGSVGGTTISIPTSSGIRGASQFPIRMQSVTNANIQKIDVSYSGGSRSGTGLTLDSNCTGFNGTNIVASNRSTGIVLPTGTISCSGFLNCDTGVAVGNALTISQSVLQGNTTAINSGSNPVTATNNYWGAANGPSNLGGTGNGYTGSAITASPFLTTAPACTCGTIPKGLIDVKGLGNIIANGDSTPISTDDTDFGSVQVSVTSSPHTFMINNTGPVALNLTGTPKVLISGTNPGDFTVTTQPAATVAATNGTTTFVVTFNPTATGTRLATVSIASDDCANTPYTFAIKGTGLNPPDYTVTTNAGALVITDNSGNSDTMGITEPLAGNIQFAVGFRTFSVNGAAVTTTLSGNISLSGITSVTVNNAAGNDTVNVGAFTGSFPSLTINGGAGNDTVNFNGNITFAANSNLTVDLTTYAAGGDVDAINFNSTAALNLSGTGATVLKCSQSINQTAGCSLTTVNGNLTLSANQGGTPTAGNFVGIDVNAAIIQATGTGIVTVQGKGGDGAGGLQVGVQVRNGGTIRGGATGASTVITGTGGAGSGGVNYGAVVDGAGSRITSGGGNVSVTGNGSAAGSDNRGIEVMNGGQVTSGGSGTVTVTGTGGGGAG